MPMSMVSRCGSWYSHSLSSWARSWMRFRHCAIDNTAGRRQIPGWPWLSLAAPPRFLQLKISLTGVGVWWLAAHQQFPLARRGLHGLTLGYGVVLVSHLVLSFRLV